ncbi:hypothetical protein SAMN04488516_11411 [Desulfonauticus submarinus]|uniref:Uncharacterized protein n=1 Tax=Desulfonauticus submarinus TaxID=206665 RepID=A0A1H0FSF7_9BACT|nr:hypothetical protein [Desulfonauticus submarinus]SDN97608.1 hypothetical protein SAMN04488516_11411 [Desulfonauticus submarinus]
MEKLIVWTNFCFDPLHALWESKKGQEIIASLLVFIFTLSLVLIELKRFNLLPSSSFSLLLPSNPFFAVHLAFSLLLIFEVISFIFVLPCSVSKAVGKQLEILSLIFLRNCFKLLTEFNEPINFASHLSIIWQIGTYALGSLLIYLILFFYYLILKDAHKKEQIRGKNIFYFVGSKKIISLLLLVIFISMGVYNIYSYFNHKQLITFFNEFYTLLIFSDILIVLIAHRYFPTFKDTFRNSGYAIATLLMRLCLTAPIYYDVIIGLMASCFALALTFIYMKTKKET